MPCSQKYDITLVSPRNYFLYTPLLPAVATGTVEERSIVEPIRRIMAGKVKRCMTSSVCVITSQLDTLSATLAGMNLLGLCFDC